MASQEVLEQAGIVHTAGVIDRAQAAELEAECRQLFEVSRDDLYFISEWNPIEDDTDALVTARNYPLTSLQASGLVVLNSVLEQHHPYFGTRDANVLVNRQEPDSAQVFHGDLVKGYQLLVYASDDGAFDFFMTHDAPDFETADISAGDFLKLTRPYIRHRGRNPSNHTRYGLVLSQTSEMD